MLWIERLISLELLLLLFSGVWLKNVFQRAGKQLRIFPCYETNSILQYAEENYGPAFAVTSLAKNAPRPDLRNVLFENYKDSAHEVSIMLPRGAEPGGAAICFIRFMQEYCNNLLSRRPDFPLDN